MSDKKYKIKYGLKLWSVNKELFSEAVELFKKGQVDFIELYIVPDSLSSKGDILKDVLTTIHAPHMGHDFSVFGLDEKKVRFFKEQVIKTADFLESKFIVVHAEGGDSKDIFKKNIKKINDKRILIENSMKFGKDDFGYSLVQLKFIKECGFDFCFDFAHAIKTAIGQKIDYKKFIEEIVSGISPFYFHLSNGCIEVATDEHRDLFDGEFDIKWIKEKLSELAEKRDIYLVFETPKGENGLENDIKNINYFRSL